MESHAIREGRQGRPAPARLAGRGAAWPAEAGRSKAVDQAPLERRLSRPDPARDPAARSGGLPGKPRIHDTHRADHANRRQRSRAYHARCAYAGPKALNQGVAARLPRRPRSMLKEYIMSNVTLQVTLKDGSLDVNQSGNGNQIAHGQTVTITWHLSGAGVNPGSFNAINDPTHPGFAWIQSPPSGVFGQPQLADNGDEITITDANDST